VYFLPDISALSAMVMFHNIALLHINSILTLTYCKNSEFLYVFLIQLNYKNFR